jgi:hypothetical protein
MLIVNTKQKIDEEGKAEILNRVSDNLQQIGDENGISTLYNDVSITFVNAQSGLKGKLDNKLVLLENSGLPQLEKQITNFLATCGAKTKANTFANRLKLIIEKVQKAIVNEIKMMEKKSASMLREMTTENKNRLSIELNAKAQEIISCREPDLRDALKLDEQAVQQIIDQIIKEIEYNIHNETLSILQELAKYFTQNVDEPNVSIDSDINVDTNILESHPEKNLESKWGFDVEFSTAGLTKVGLETTAARLALVAGLEAAATAGALGSMGASAAALVTGPVGWAVAAAFTFISLFKKKLPTEAEINAHNDEQEKRLAKQQVATNHAIKEVSYRLINLARDGIKNTITTVFTDIDKSLYELQQEEEKQNQQLSLFNRHLEILIQSEHELETFLLA